MKRRNVWDSTIWKYNNQLKSLHESLTDVMNIWFHWVVHRGIEGKFVFWNILLDKLWSYDFDKIVTMQSQI